MSMSLVGLALSGVEIPLVRARNAGPARPGQRVDLVVIHTMEALKRAGTARAVAEWFAGASAPEASAHYCVDADEIIQCVPEDVVAWCAPGANRRGVHLEHAGYAGQSAAAWDDDYSRRVLALSAALARDIAARHQIPIVHLTPDELRKGARGFCGHAEVSKAWPSAHPEKDHWDPGPGFPWDQYLDLVRGPTTVA
jgi:N-acetyl-anhydromuramyl-L-alanine amidase AmpD